MTRIEKLTIAVTVVVLGIGSMALMWTNRQAGQPARDDGAVTTTPAQPVTTTRTEAPPVAPPRPAMPAPIPAAVAAPREDTSGGVAPQAAVAPVAQAAAPPSDGVQPTEDERAQRREQRNQAVRSLQAIEAQLATGNTDGVDEVLSNTGEQLDEPARGAVSAARVALENKDLTLARAEVMRAIAASPVR